MLKIEIPETEMWDEKEQEFISCKEQTLALEHSLVSVSKWESKWHKPFMSRKDKTEEEAIDYIKCMTITQNVDDKVYKCLSYENIKQINDYIEDPMTATWFNDSGKGRRSNEIVTSEIIYYWMIALNIPLECQKWHLNKLLTLIQVCNIKNQPQKSRSRNEILKSNAAINAARRKKYHTSG